MALPSAYDVGVSSPRSIRFDPTVEARLTSYVARHPGLSSSSVAARLVDEGLRMEEHPGVAFREGPIGRRATLVGGPDVWEVIRAVKSARSAEPDLPEDELLALVADNSGLSVRVVRTAVAYWATYPDEVEALLGYAGRMEQQTVLAQDRTDSLLAR
jgi:hypothetical protein